MRSMDEVKGTYRKYYFSDSGNFPILWKYILFLEYFCSLKMLSTGIFFKFTYVNLKNMHVDAEIKEIFIFYKMSIVN